MATQEQIQQIYDLHVSNDRDLSPDYDQTKGQYNIQANDPYEAYMAKQGLSAINVSLTPASFSGTSGEINDTYQFFMNVEYSSGNVVQKSYSTDVTWAVADANGGDDVLSGYATITPDGLYENTNKTSVGEVEVTGTLTDGSGLSDTTVIDVTL